MVDRFHRSIARAVIRRDCHSTHTCSADDRQPDHGAERARQRLQRRPAIGHHGMNGKQQDREREQRRHQVAQPRPLFVVVPRGAFR